MVKPRSQVDSVTDRSLNYLKFSKGTSFKRVACNSGITMNDKLILIRQRSCKTVLKNLAKFISAPYYVSAVH